VHIGRINAETEETAVFQAGISWRVVEAKCGQAHVWRCTTKIRRPDPRPAQSRRELEAHDAEVAHRVGRGTYRLRRRDRTDQDVRSDSPLTLLDCSPLHSELNDVVGLDVAEVAEQLDPIAVFVNGLWI
jgi:hypothetical protein